MEEEKKRQQHPLCPLESLLMQTPKLGGDLNTSEAASTYIKLCFVIFVGLKASNVTIFYLRLATARVLIIPTANPTDILWHHIFFPQEIDFFSRN